MTPHGILDDIDRLRSTLGDRLGEYWHEGDLADAATMIARAVAFEFGEACPLSEHLTFADEMLSRGLMRLPFECVLMTATAIPETGIVVRQNVSDNVLRRMQWFVVAPSEIDGARLHVPLMWGELVSDDGSPDLHNHGIVNWRSITTVRHSSRKTREPWSDETYQTASEKVVSFLCGASVLLISKDVEVSTIAVPDRLNKKREKRGRRPIGERRIVRIKLDRRSAYTSASDDFRSGRSVSMHFRRGHFRTLSKDREIPLIVPVAPTIVGAKDDAVPMAKTYRISQ